MKRARLFIGWLVGAGVLAGAAATPPAATAPARAATTTAEMLESLEADFVIADKALNDAYQRLLNKQDATGQEKVKAAERAWIAFRDAECTLKADRARGGTLAPVIAANCRLHMTRQRIRELNTLLEAGK